MMKIKLLTAIVAMTLMTPVVMAAKTVTVPAAKTQTKNMQVNINTASADQLAQLNGIGKAKAVAIVDYRKKHGKFTKAEDLANVKGIGVKLVAKNKAKIKFK